MPTRTRRRLTETHPFHKKLNDLFSYMEKEGIHIEVNSYCTIVTDTQNNKQYYLEDNDHSERLPEFPAFAEFKLIIPEE